MTIREMYVNAISALQGNEIECSTDELIQMLTERLEKHDAQNEKRKAADRKPSAKQLAAQAYDEQLMKGIEELLTDEFQGRLAFAEALNITPEKASSLIRKMVAAGTVEKGEIKGEKGKLVGYKRAN